MFPPSLSLSLPWFSLSVCHSYLWEIRLETVIEKRGGAKSGRRVATHVLCLYSSSSSTAFSISFSSCHEVTFGHSPSLNHLEIFSLFFIFIFNLSLATSLCFPVSPLASISGLSFSSTVSLSLSELSVQTVEYMLSKYTSPLSLRLNKLQQGERKREAVGQEEGRMGAEGGDEACKKMEYSSKTTPARVALN